MPEGFDGSPEFYSTLFHEMAHSTGHKTRLAREGIVNHINFGSHNYSKEELVAEMSAAFLCGRSGIESTFENSAAYIATWREKLTSDKHVIVSAASQADKAVRFITGELREEQTEE